MVIQHNISAINSYRNLGINQSALSSNLEKLSSGYKINRAGDDAAGLAISEQMRSKINALDQAVSNAEDSIGLIQTAEGALTETHSMLQRMTTLATQASNGTYDSTARDNIQEELDQLKEEIDRIASSTKFNGKTPLIGSQKMTFQIGSTEGETLNISTTSMKLSDLGIGGTGGTNLSVSTEKAAAKLMTAVETAINNVSKYRAVLGAAQNRMEYTVRNLEVTSENITAAESRIRDTDMADEITAYTKNNILLQAAQSMLSQANSTPQSVLSMLQ